MARQMKDSGIEWIGEIPEGWGIHTASQLFSQVKHKNEGMQEDNLLSLSYGKIIKKSINTTEGLLPENFEGYNIIEPNDIVLRLTDLQNDHTSLRVGLSEQRGIITSAYLTIRNESDCFERYLYYQLHSFDICKGFYGMGAGVRQGLNWDGIKMLKLVRPTVAEQHRIAAFLDRKCAEIDAVIEHTKATIEEYKKLKQAVITEAVTKGVRGARKMKDSGIEWVKQIPEEWDNRKMISILAMRVIDGPHESPELFESGIPYISANAIENGKINFDKKRGFISEGYCDLCDKRYKPQRNDLLVIKLGATTGQVAIVETNERFNIWVPLAALRCNKLANPQFVYYAMQSDYYLRQMELSWTFGTQQTLGVKTIERLRILLPNVAEQIEIVDYLRSRCEKLDTLIAKKTALLTELETYKKSLIYECVTGKREIV